MERGCFTIKKKLVVGKRACRNLVLIKFGGDFSARNLLDKFQN